MLRSAWWLKVSVRVKTPGHNIRLPIAPIAMYVFYFALISFESWTGFMPRKIRVWAKAALYTLEQGIIAAAASGPQEFVRADIKAKDTDVRVRVRTL